MPVSDDRCLSDLHALLHRQVHSSFVRDGRVSSMAFRPTPKDHGQLSVSDGRKVGPREAFERYIGRGFQSCGVWSVSVTECDQAGMKAYEDPLDDDDAHALIDFSRLDSRAQQKKAADKLAAAARARGCMHSP